MPTPTPLPPGPRAQVQPKLQNFMFPAIPERPVVLTELFASVFGQRVVSRDSTRADAVGVADHPATALFAPSTVSS